MLKTAIAHFQQRNEAFLTAYLQAQSPHAQRLLDAVKYGVLNGGKRIRPFLVYSIGDILGAKENDLDYAAAAIECIHAYSLIHDDLPAMDDDALRRGKPTCHIAFDEATAILAGDALQALAFELLSTPKLTHVKPAQQLQALHALAKASGYMGMCGGQAMDIEATGQTTGELSTLESIHAKKTGALITAAVELGIAFSPEGGEETHNALLVWAQHIGQAFQVHDDILDVIGKYRNTRKNPRRGTRHLIKWTYPSLLGLETGRKRKT